MVEPPCTPPQLRELAAAAVEDLMPGNDRSKYRYILAYEKFCEWRESQNTTLTSENILLVYFQHLFREQEFAPTTLWSVYSMLKKMVDLKEGIQISKFLRVTKYLTMKMKGYTPKRSLILEGHHVNRFLRTAPDDEFLVIKVAMVFGLFGACHKCELVTMLRTDVTCQGKLFKVMIPRTKNGKPRWFVIAENFHDLVQRYIDLRPNPCSSERFFLNYTKNKKCTNQPIGENKFAGFPKLIARFLELPNADSYTGHSFRRSAASIISEEGGSIEDVQNAGGWMSPAVAKIYIDQTLRTKKSIGNFVAVGISNHNDENTSNTDRNNEVSPPNKKQKVGKFAAHHGSFSSSLSSDLNDAANRQEDTYFCQDTMVSECVDDANIIGSTDDWMI